MGYHFLLQGIFLTYGLNLHLLCFLHCGQIPYPLSHQGFTFLEISRSLNYSATVLRSCYCRFWRRYQETYMRPFFPFVLTGVISVWKISPGIHFQITPGKHPSKVSARIRSVQFSRSVMSDSLRPHESQHARPSCPSPTPRIYSNTCPSSRWCHPAISSSVVPSSFCPQSLPASGSFPMSQLFTWGGQSTGVSASASVLLMNIQD